MSGLGKWVLRRAWQGLKDRVRRLFGSKKPPVAVLPPSRYTVRVVNKYGTRYPYVGEDANAAREAYWNEHGTGTAFFYKDMQLRHQRELRS